MSTCERMCRSERMLRDSRPQIRISETKNVLSKNDSLCSSGEDWDRDNNCRTAAPVRRDSAGLPNVDSNRNSRRKTSCSKFSGNTFWFGALLISSWLGIAFGASGNSPFTVQIGTLMRAQNGRVQRVIVEQIRNISEATPPGPDSILATYQAYDHKPGDLLGTNFT